jgi:hypothetical protein
MNDQTRAHAIVDAHKTATQATDQQLEFSRVLIQMRELYIRKNAAYGNGAIGSTGLYGIAVRMSDKVHRLLTLTRSASTDPGDESITDTLLDLAVYAVIGVVYLRGKWGTDDSSITTNH